MMRKDILYFEDFLFLRGDLLVYDLDGRVGQLLDRVLCVLRLRPL